LTPIRIYESILDFQRRILSALSAIRPKSLFDTSCIAHTVPAGFSYKNVRKIYLNAREAPLKQGRKGFREAFPVSRIIFTEDRISVALLPAYPG